MRAGATTARIPVDISSIAFDLIIIGAGINGAGIARDASMRGLRVLLLDKGDISSGTSAWSTRLIHGGLRYLEYAEVALVRESLRERATLLRTAPHLVHPLDLMIPIYRTSRRGRWTIRAGLTAYDLLSAGASLGRHRMLTPEAALAVAPGLKTDGLVAAAVYRDAQVEFAERLVLENAIDAKLHGATVITYATVSRILTDSGAAVGVDFTDELTGDRLTARAPLIINVAGPWVDRVLAGLDHPPARLIGGTRGSHIIVAPFPGAPSSALYSEARADGRPFFIIPWNNLYLIGTTDIRHDADPGEARADDAEIAYLLAETNHVLPAAGLIREQVLYTYSGVRPLPYEPEKRPSQITRRHIIRDHAADPHPVRNLFSIIGGKLTTYRSLAEEAVTLAMRRLGRNDPGCTTAAIPLPGARTTSFDHYCAEFAGEFRLPDEVCRRLLHVYGTRAGLIALRALRAPALAARLPGDTPAIAAEIIHAIADEMAQTIPDILCRRTMFYFAPDRGLPALDAIAALARTLWPSQRVESGVQQYRASTPHTTAEPAL